MTDISSIYNKARQALPLWRKTELSQRIEVVQKFSRLLEENKGVLARILSSEMGKPVSQAESEIKNLLPRIDFFIEHIVPLLSTKLMRQLDSIQESISYEPLGVIANISAWNYPYFVGANVFVPALLCGNCVLYKPSEYTGKTGAEIGRLWQEAGLPDAVFQVLQGDGVVAEALLEQDIDGVFFTGSYVTGQKISQKLSGRMIPLQLELGGKDAVYVHSDVDVPTAATSLVDGAFYNNGQSCCAVERIYVHSDIHDVFVSAFLKELASFKLGDPADSDVYFGPLARPQQSDFLKAQIQDAIDKGAKLETGGKESPYNGAAGVYFEPTVLTSVDHRMDLMRWESFGPLIGIQKVENPDEALSLMQDSEYGLTGGVYTKDEALARELLEQLDTGSVYWNVCDRISPWLPWSGRRHSGLGSTLSLEGIRAFLKPKAWHWNKG